jgi:hypothetical protein
LANFTEIEGFSGFYRVKPLCQLPHGQDCSEKRYFRKDTK